MKNKAKRGLVLAIGILLCIYPFAGSELNRWFQDRTIASIQKVVEEKENLTEVFDEALQYNRMLIQMRGGLIGDEKEKIPGCREYDEQLNIMGNGIMGIIEIPKINVRLPIRHGTKEEVLKNGVGHLPDSSLPVGGNTARCILTSHRGLPSARLFTRLDEMKKGDLFYIDICSRTLAYQVYEIEVIEPEDTERLDPIPDKDIVSLVTCTPYGINTRRLVVTGERVKYTEKVRDEIKPEIVSIREVVFRCIPVLTGAAVVITVLRKRKKRCEGYERDKKGNRNDTGLHFKRSSRRRRRKGARKRKDQDRA